MQRMLVPMAVLVLTLGACRPADSSAPSPQPADAQPAVNCPPTAAPAVPACPTQAPASDRLPQTLSATVSSGNLTLRSGPSAAHAVLGSYPFGTPVEVLGKAPGGGWVVVSAVEGRLGWMYTLYLDIEGPLDNLVEVQPTESWTIAGRVIDDSGEPVESVPIAIELGVPGDTPIFTDVQGRFVLFAPNSQEGPWPVSVWGEGCQSRVVGNGCALKGFVLRNPTIEYTPGQDRALEFVYEATDLTLRGKVQDEAGNLLAATNVLAARRDGARVTGFTGVDGAFDIPITAGTWSVWAQGGSPKAVVVPEGGYAGELLLIGAGKD
jgi:hypothetical protein